MVGVKRAMVKIHTTLDFIATRSMEIDKYDHQDSQTLMVLGINKKVSSEKCTRHIII